MIPIILLFSLHSSLAPNFPSRKCLGEELIFWIPVAVLMLSQELDGDGKYPCFSAQDEGLALHLDPLCW